MRDEQLPAGSRRPVWPTRPPAGSHILQLVDKDAIDPKKIVDACERKKVSR